MMATPDSELTGEPRPSAARVIYGKKPAFGMPFLPCDPESEPLVAVPGEPSQAFCAQWNPEFNFNGNRCCAVKPVHARRRGRRRTPASGCSVKRAIGTYCGERTPAQIAFEADGATGKLGDMMKLLNEELGRHEQAFCTVNTGFLAHGRALIPSAENRVQLRASARCTNFGTDPMVAMIEWLGRKVDAAFPGPDYKDLHFLIGDVAAPRGGCLAAKGGRRGHASHTSGQDADLGFLVARAGHASPDNFVRDLDLRVNWWFLKKLFENPYACVKVIFLDRKHIKHLAKYAWNDPDWRRYGRFLQHQKGHANHFHVRIGTGPGIPGCVGGSHPELETEDDEGDGEVYEDATDAGSVESQLEAAGVPVATRSP